MEQGNPQEIKSSNEKLRWLLKQKKDHSNQTKVAYVKLAKRLNELKKQYKAVLSEKEQVEKELCDAKLQIEQQQDEARQSENIQNSKIENLNKLREEKDQIKKESKQRT